ncbi:PucR family transcriptional regulator ligand-binding domain-containing protein, partial [Clostridiaceae bacterium HSG29]|nr:PucR family transcriptional regulator ligand-binding domain-containing protein [Clostridiaceae bacterium HSG29]
MTITIHEILKLKKFKNFQLIAGVNGLDRIVTRGSFIDHEMPDEINNSEYNNEMIFSNLPLTKNSPEKIVKYIEALYNANSACFAIKTTFFNKIQDDAIETANRLGFPLFLFDDIYIEELILEIDQEVNSKKQDLKKIEIINEIENSNLNSFKIKELAYELNHYFKPYYISIYVKPFSD